jgi:cytidine deaminase
MNPDQIDVTSLLRRAASALDNSYSPYSGQQVSAAVLAMDGVIHAGVNVENCSYGATLCAERVAIGSAIAAGARAIHAILVLTRHREPWSPCGLCRQMIAELAVPGAIIYMANLGGVRRRATIEALLPDRPPREWARL